MKNSYLQYGHFDESCGCFGQPGYGPDCAGILQVKLQIPPGGSERIDFVLGQAATPDEVSELKGRITPSLLDNWCEEVKLAEEKRASAYKVETGYPLYDGLFNIFIKKQHYNYLINKSGFREDLQVDAALAMSDYHAAEANFLRALASQYETGSVPRGFRPLNCLHYSDKPAWILFALPELLKEGGDFALLERKVPYFKSKESGTVSNHALRAMRFLAEDTGAHGLCDQHYADWNDGLEATKQAGPRESVMVSMQFCPRRCPKSGSCDVFVVRITTFLFQGETPAGSQSTETFSILREARASQLIPERSL